MGIHTEGDIVPCGGKKRSGPKRFSSKAQWGWAFASGQPWARRHAHNTRVYKAKRRGTAYRRLPTHVRKTKGHRRIRR